MRSPKVHIQKLLQRVGLLNRLRSSSLHELYWRILGKGWIQVREKQIDFYRTFLAEMRPGDVIFDIGANEGYKTEMFLRLGARVVAIEPDKTNQSILRDRFLKLRFTPKPVLIVGKAVSDKSSVATMWIDGPGSAVNTLSEKWANTLHDNRGRHACANSGLEFKRRETIETTTVEQLMSAHGIPIFIKIDVEGYELNVIRGMRRPVPYLSFEVNLPEFRSEGLECVEILGRLAAGGRFNYAVECEQGMALGRWLTAEEFRPVLSNVEESAIEVFWKGAAAEGRPSRVD